MTPRSLELRLLIALGMTACSITSPQDKADAPAPAATPPPSFDTPQPDGPRYDGMSIAVFDGPFAFGDIAVQITGAPPNSEVIVVSGTGSGPGTVSVLGVPSDMADPKVVGIAMTNDVGVATLRGPHQVVLPIGQMIGVQVLARTGQWRSQFAMKALAPFDLICGPATFNEYQPDMPMIFCDTQVVPGQCDSVENVLAPLAAISAVVPGAAQVNAEAVCFEPGGTAACCYQFIISGIDSGWSGGGETGGWAAGRPFRVHGAQRHSDVIRLEAIAGMDCPERLRDVLTAAWIDAARAEHASVAAFARFTLELMQLGAPLDLLRDATRAQADEILHARLTLEIASQLAREELELGPLPMEGALDGRDLRTVVMDVVREGCINETVSALFAMEARDRAENARIREIQAVLAEDESRHSELAWRFVRWALEQEPSLRPDVLAVLSDFAPDVTAEPDPDGGRLGAFGVLDEHTSQTVARRAARVIARCTASLC